MKNTTSTTLLALLITLAAGIGIGLAIAGDGAPSAPPAPGIVDEDSVVSRPEPSITQARSGRAASSSKDRTEEIERSIRRKLTAQSGISPTAESGDGKIVGIVENARGEPLGRVELVARRRSAQGPSKPRRIGGPAPTPQTLESALETSAERWRARRSSEFRTTTDASGHFAFDQLPEGRYQISAYREGFQIQTDPQKYEFDLGASVRFVARPVYEVAFDVRLPDGSQPQQATLQIQTNNRNESALWTPERPTRQIVEPLVQVLARSFVGDQVRASGSSQDRSRFRSELLSVSPAQSSDAPVRIELLPRHGILGRVENLNDGQSLMARLVANSPGQEPDWNQSMATSWCRDGEFLFSDLQPGNYVVGLGDPNGKPLASARVQVTAGFAECSLELPPEDPETTTIVRCLTPDGSPLPNVQLSLSAAKDGQSKGSTGISPRTGADGTSLVRLGNNQRVQPEWLEPDHQLRFVGTLQGLPPAAASWQRGQDEVVLQFVEGCDLTIQVTGLSEEMRTKLVVEVHYLAPELQGRSVSSASRNLSPFGGQTQQPKLDANGAIRFAGIAPGPIEIKLAEATDRFRTKPLNSTRAEAIPGPQPIAVALPVLHDFVVYAPNLPNETSVELHPLDENNRPLRDWNSRQRTRTGPDKRARFSRLPAGTYELHVRSARVAERVTIPSGEYQVTASPPNAVKVLMTDPTGFLGKQGFQNGDVIVAVGETELNSENLSQTFRRLMDGPQSVTVLRGGRRVTVQSEALPLSPTPENLGGQIEPTSR